MKHIPASNSKKTFPSMPVAPDEEAFTPAILADSLEVMEAYSFSRVAALEAELNGLTIADHTREIISICQQIKKERKLLLKIIAKK